MNYFNIIIIIKFFFFDFFLKEKETTNAISDNLNNQLKKIKERQSEKCVIFCFDYVVDGMKRKNCQEKVNDSFIFHW